MNHRTNVVAALAAILLAGPALAAEKPCPHCHGAKDGAAPQSAAAPADAARVEIADVSLVDQHGAPVRLRDALAGDPIVVVDFVYTSCTTVCPALSGIMARVQERLGERAGKDVRIVSISIDPSRDTPARLEAFASRFGSRVGWTWLTGEQGAVEQALKGLGAYTASFADHAPIVLVGDGKAGAWTRLNGFPSPERIVAKVDELSRARSATARVAKEVTP